MAFKDGDDAISGECFGFPEANALKNHFRGSALPSWEPGLIFSDSDDDKLWHAIGMSSAWDEVLQATGSANVTPLFHALKLNVFSHDVSDPPTDAQLDATTGSTPAAVGSGYLALVKDITSSGKLYLFGSDGTSWWTLTFALAV